jgi:hypothetical protein
LKLKLGVVRAVLRPALHWNHVRGDRDGYSIVLGVPWMLRQLLTVNMRFLRRCDLADLDTIHVVFDQVPHARHEAFAEDIAREFGNLPLTFHSYGPVSGRIVQITNNASLFACMNWTLGLRAARTRYVLLHDFDLYPTDSGYFRRLYETLRDEQLYFTAYERTYHDGLTDGDDILGTWSLGIDADWLRQRFAPVSCFHAVAKVNGRLTSLDGLTHIETMTDRRRLCDPKTTDRFVHVTNLCSIYRRYRSGQHFAPAWRLHMLWYLQFIAGDDRPIRFATDAMRAADSARISFAGHSADFSRDHVTCANVLRKSVARMEYAMIGRIRPIVGDYLDASDAFWARFADHSQIIHPDGTVGWCAEGRDPDSAPEQCKHV